MAFTPESEVRPNNPWLTSFPLAKRTGYVLYIPHSIMKAYWNNYNRYHIWLVEYSAIVCCLPTAWKFKLCGNKNAAVPFMKKSTNIKSLSFSHEELVKKALSVEETSRSCNVVIERSNQSVANSWSPWISLRWMLFGCSRSWPVLLQMIYNSKRFQIATTMMAKWWPCAHTAYSNHEEEEQRHNLLWTQLNLPIWSIVRKSL